MNKRYRNTNSPNNQYRRSKIRTEEDQESENENEDFDIFNNEAMENPEQNETENFSSNSGDTDGPRLPNFSIFPSMSFLCTGLPFDRINKIEKEFSRPKYMRFIPKQERRTD